MKYLQLNFDNQEDDYFKYYMYLKSIIEINI
jgi:hypothetical protein